MCEFHLFVGPDVKSVTRMKICSKCSWENQDEFNFCLGCGSQLNPASKKESPKPSPSTPEPPSSMAMRTVEDVYSSTPAKKQGDSTALQAEPSANPSSVPVVCSHCGATIPPGHVFCGQCGTRLASVAPAPVPPQPTQPPPAPAAPPVATTSSPSVAEARARLVLLLPNGEEGGSYPLRSDVTEIGRRQGNILFLDDPYVSPLHAVFYYENGQLRVRNEQSFNGLFIRLRKRVPLHHGDVVLLGKQLLRFEQLHTHPDTPSQAHVGDSVPVWGSPYGAYWGRLIQLISGGFEGNAILLGGEQIELGRERGQITFPGDRFISSLHARIAFENQQFFLEDVGSRNGTFTQIRDNLALSHKDILIIGEQLLRVEINV